MDPNTARQMADHLAEAVEALRIRRGEYPPDARRRERERAIEYLTADRFILRFWADCMQDDLENEPARLAAEREAVFERSEQIKRLFVRPPGATSQSATGRV